MRASSIDLSVFSKHSGWFLLWGILVTLLGLAAISAAFTATMISVIFLGILILIAGSIIIFDSFTFWWGKWSGFFWHLLMGVLYFAVGFLMIDNPILGSVSITFLLGVFYLIVGLFRIIFAASSRLPHWGWGFFNGLISLLLGVLILASWPGSSLFIIGIFVGIDLVFCGIAYIMAAMTAKAMSKAF